MALIRPIPTSESLVITPFNGHGHGTVPNFTYTADQAQEVTIMLNASIFLAPVTIYAAGSVIGSLNDTGNNKIFRSLSSIHLDANDTITVTGNAEWWTQITSTGTGVYTGEYI